MAWHGQAGHGEAGIYPMKNTANVHFDNIATPSHPVWRRRQKKPFTCYALRMELVRQAADLPDAERVLYVKRRLTPLDKALDDVEAEALETWLACEEWLSGRAKIGDYGAGAGGGNARTSQLPDRIMPLLAGHALMKRRLRPGYRRALGMLALMMESKDWDFGIAGLRVAQVQSYAKARRLFIALLCQASGELVKLREISQRRSA